MQLEAQETNLIGQWEILDGNVVDDATSKRIKQLVDRHLEKVAGGGWETLYRDPTDGRYWELTYPQGEMHGGGPPQLTYLSEQELKKKYSDLG